MRSKVVVGLLMVSVPEVPTVTSLVYQLFAPDVPAVTASAAEGGVASNLKVEDAVSGLLMFPATSVQLPLTDVLSVSGPL